jgi:hypothetical protein
MTLAQFLRRLRKTPRDWKINRADEIRRYPRGRKPQCPVTALVDMDEALLDETAEALGIPFNMVDEIQQAADGDLNDEPKLKRLRGKLLQACGLRKVKA